MFIMLTLLSIRNYKVSILKKLPNYERNRRRQPDNLHRMDKETDMAGYFKRNLFRVSFHF